MGLCTVFELSGRRSTAHVFGEDLYRGECGKRCLPDHDLCGKGGGIQSGFRRRMQFVAIAVVTSNGGRPCGSCRQVLAEFGLDTLVFLADCDGNLLQETSVAELLPGAFGPKDLNAK